MNPLEWLLTYSPVAWLDALSAHQLDVVRTSSIAIGSGCVPLLGFLLGWGIKLLRSTNKNARQAKEQTAHVEYVNGKERSIPVVEYARHAVQAGEHAAVSGEATRQEVSDLGGWMRGGGRRRLPTTDVPRIDPRRPEDSSYE